MNISLVILLVEIVSSRTYNILAVDGGAIRGIISAECIKEMELYAY